MVHDKDRLYDGEGRSFALTHNLKGDSITEWVKQFEANEKNRTHKRTDSAYIKHEILSWHRDDAKNITLAKMEEMAREYIKRRNPKGLYVAVPHFDKDHYHIHVCASGVDKTGKSLRLSKVELRKLKKDIQQYQIEKFPELSKSIVNHDKKEKSPVSEKEYQFKLRTGRQSDKEQILGILKTCYKASNSKEDFYLKLKECGVNSYKRGGKTTGIIFGKHKFRFNRLGYTEERLEDLNRSLKRGKQLSEVRKKGKEININHNR